jgi:hypothetical protein
MGTVLYTPALVELSDEEKDDAIVKAVIIEESTSNISGDDIKKICVKLSGAKKETCYAQLEGSEKTDYTEKQLVGYWKAVGKGYTKSIDDFVKKQDTLSKLLGYGTTLGTALSGLATTSSNQGTDYSETTDNKKLSRNAKIGIAVGSVVVLGTIAYFIFRKK